jgi:alpha-mannosidase
VEHIIPADKVKAGRYEVVIEVTCNSMFGLGTYRYQTPDVSQIWLWKHRSLVGRIDTQLERTFPLVSADILVPDLEARGLRYDFRILAEVARHPDGRLQGLSQRALKAADDIMNTFRRRQGDVQDGFIANIIQQCRSIAWDVLGDLDKDNLKKVCMRDTSPREGKMWAMGHWCVPISTCDSCCEHL